MSGLLGLLIAVIVLCLIAYIVFWALGQIPMPEPVRTVVTVLVALVLLIFIIRQFGLLLPAPPPPLGLMVVIVWI